MKKVFLTFLFLSTNFCVFSQEKPSSDKEKEVDEIIDSLFEDEEVVIDELIESINNFEFLYVSLDYNNDTYFSGRDIGIDQFNIRPQITYMNSKGFIASLSGIYYSEFVPNWDFTAASIGYGKSLGKKKMLRLYSSYSRYFYSNGVNNPFKNTLTLGASIRNKKRTLGTQLSNTFLFGGKESFQISSTSFTSINFLKTKKSTLKLRPQLNITIGKQTFELAQTYILNGVTYTTYLENDVFGLINTQINLPLQLTTNSFDFELGYNINFPSAISTESNLNTTGFFNFSVAYLFDL